MQYRRLGKSGLQVSAMGLGSWTTYGKQVDEAQAGQCLKAALDGGINLFDTAEGYADGRAEEILGRFFHKQGVARRDLVICTKVFFGGDGPNHEGLSRKHILEGLDASLKRLRMEYVDIFLCHRPDPHTPIEETVRAMDHLVRQGKVLYWGTSLWSREQIGRAIDIAGRQMLTPPTLEQPPYSLIERRQVEDELAPLSHAHGLGLTTYSPLYGGVLTGKYRNDAIPPGSRGEYRGADWVTRKVGAGSGEHRSARIAKLVAMADRLGTTPAALAIAWCLHNPRVSSVITGASLAEQVRDNLAAIQVVTHLSGEHVQRLNHMFPPAED
ncbi:MAG: aldo/keto reductase [Nitrospirota bacterium]|nr:aldo/keto reductase [Nitrospirota bacterium]